VLIRVDDVGPEGRLKAVDLEGDLAAPDHPDGVVVFAHGSGSSRLSPRNRQVARSLQDDGFATLLFDLLTEAEDAADRHTRSHRFDISLLARRLIGAIDWLDAQPGMVDRPLGLFGASTGAAAALVAAAERPQRVRAVVSRGGRPDLAMDVLDRVRAPTLLIVGERDPEVLALNRRAAAALRSPYELTTVVGATHLFEEPGALEEVARTSGAWFRRHLAGTPSGEAARRTGG
jgi:putative phosphoribosyl transferase